MSRDMTGNPSVSVIIATYNMARTLAESLDSVRVQSFEDWEMIVVDDGSTDNTLQLAEQFIRLEPRCRIVTQDHPELMQPGTSGSRLPGVSGYCFSMGTTLSLRRILIICWVWRFPALMSAQFTAAGFASVEVENSSEKSSVHQSVICSTFWRSGQHSCCTVAWSGDRSW